MKIIWWMACCAALGGVALVWSEASAKDKNEGIPRALATFDVGGRPDWIAFSPDAVWVSNEKLNAIHRIDPATNKVVAKIDLPSGPCSGLVFAFGNLWVPLCGEESGLVRIDPATNKVVQGLRIAPADPEGSIAGSEDSIWMVVDAEGMLARIDPKNNELVQAIRVPAGSYNAVYSDGIIWVTGNESDVLTPVDAKSGEVLQPIAVGPKPRFLTAGDGAVWTLNQGDGSVTRVDAKTRRVTATIAAGIPGHGGEITFGDGAVWATVMDTPLTKIDAKTNKIVKQWKGPGGDSVKFGHGSVWLTDLRGGIVWRLPAL